MGFELAVMGGFVALALVFLALGKWYPGTGAEQLDWKPARSYEDEVRLEMEDVEQMLDAQNERRRRRGAPELTEDDIREQVESDQRTIEELSERYSAKPGDDPKQP